LRDELLSTFGKFCIDDAILCIVWAEIPAIPAAMLLMAAAAVVAMFGSVSGVKDGKGGR